MSIYPMTEEEFFYCSRPDFSVNVLVLARELGLNPTELENEITHGYVGRVSGYENTKSTCA